MGLSDTHASGNVRAPSGAESIRPGRTARGSGTGHFDSLDGWRGVCALLVAILHFRVVSHVSGVAFVRDSYLFVDFFFVLSGFVITHAYGARLAQAGDRESFCIRRFGRLWPLHITILSVFVSMELLRLALQMFGHVSHSPAFAPPNTPLSVLANVFLMQGLGFLPDGTWNLPSWSISTEFYTYLLFAAAVYASAQIARRPERSLAAIAAALIAVGLAVVISYSHGGIGADPTRLGLFRCVAGFFTGHLTYRIWQRVPLYAWPAALPETLAFVLVVVFVAIAGTGPLSFAAPFVFAAAILAFAPERSFLSGALKSGPARMLGKWSYSIYMVHYFISTCFTWTLNLAERVGHSQFHAAVNIGGDDYIVVAGKFEGDILLAIYALIVVCASALTYRVIELPGQRYFNDIAARLALRRENGTPLPRHGTAS